MFTLQNSNVIDQPATGCHCSLRAENILGKKMEGGKKTKEQKSTLFFRDL